jgi:flagellar hook-length control protein FliK
MRAPQGPDRGVATPFESLLPDNAPPPDNSHPPTDGATERAPDPAQLADRTMANKPVKAADHANSDDQTDDAPMDEVPGGDGQIAKIAKTGKHADTKTTKAAAEAKDVKELAGTDDTKAAGHTKADANADVLPAAGVAVTATVAVAQPAQVAAAITTTTAATDGKADAATAVTANAGDAVLLAAAAKLEKLAGAKTDKIEKTDKADGDAKPSAKSPADTAAKTAAPAAPHAPAKPVTDAADDKNSSANARGETSAKDEHIAAAHTGETPSTEPAAAPKAGSDALQTNALTAPAQNTAPAVNNATTAAPLAPQAAAVPFAGVAIEIASKAQSGTNHFEIRLDPPELGRIEVRMAVDRDGNVTSRLIADRSDTLDLLRRDASGLERALQDAGLKTADNGLQFSLRDQSSNQQQQNDRGSDTARLVVSDDMLPANTTQRIYSRLAGQGSGVDIHV